MIARTEGSRETGHTLDYNEQKLKQAKALFLGALNYWQDPQALTRDDKLSRLHALNIRNKRVKVHTAHISLNFHPDDVISDRQMKIIAAGFLKRIGFADQPALLYRHVDAGHPHCHIVTTNIRPNGKRISNDLRAPSKLRAFCKQLEQTHQLVPAMEYAPDGSRIHRPADPGLPRALKYGQHATKTEIEKVLKHVLKKDTYTSLDQLNHLLRPYNVMADRGSKESNLYRNRGLYYRLLDSNGKKIGAPIKASAFEDRPTLKNLEKKFAENLLSLYLQKTQKEPELVQHSITAEENSITREEKRLTAAIPQPAEQPRSRRLPIEPRQEEPLRPEPQRRRLPIEPRQQQSQLPEPQRRRLPIEPRPVKEHDHHHGHSL